MKILFKAFFLAFALDCLTVYENENELNINKLWAKLCNLDSSFPFKYAVYHKLRSKGWVVKNGIKYGSDFSKYIYYIK
jgi:tRNA-splicing endonuclease subunit Sen2